MDSSDYLAALGRDGLAFRHSVSAVSLDAPVASCPGWRNRDLIWHLSEVLYFWATVVTMRAATWKDVPRVEQVPDEELLANFDRMLARTVEVLSDADPSTPVWSWSEQGDVAFVIRRMAHETAVHRWDADCLVGEPPDIDAALASDGIDEFLEHFLADIAEGAAPVGGSVHIHCGDVAGEWTIRPTIDGYDVTREHAKGDCALRGGASDLLLVLWRRRAVETVDVVGDRDVAARFVAATNLR